MDNNELWQTVLAQIQFSVSRPNFATWFKNTKIFSYKDGQVVVSVGNLFSKEWLANKYYSLILKILRDIDKNIKSVDFIVDSSSNDFENLEKAKKSRRKKEPVYQNPFQELLIDQKTNLNPRYNFNNFVVGRFNEMAQAAGWAISENPGTIYNPLFIYGGVGLGKTHLLQAIGNRMIELNPKIKVKYLSSERFVSGVVEAIKNRKVESFKKSLKEIDVLIMDDVQFFTGKEKSQEEFFHIFNFFHQSQKQIILSSDRSPKAIPGLEERLRSRFEGGMLADIGTPDIETRIAILKEKCEENKINIDSSVLDYIANNVKSNIREMEGALNKVIFFEKINNRSPKVDDIKKLLGGIVNKPKKTTNFKKIIKTISSFYNLEEKDLLLKTRRKEIVKPRQIAMYLLRKELKESYPSIGRRFGGKDHTTAIYACSKIEKEIENNEDLLSEINIIKEQLYNGLLG